MKFFGYVDDGLNKAYCVVRDFWLYEVLNKPRPKYDFENAVKAVAMAGLVMGLAHTINSAIDEEFKKADLSICQDDKPKEKVVVKEIKKTRRTKK